MHHLDVHLEYFYWIAKLSTVCGQAIVFDMYVTGKMFKCRNIVVVYLDNRNTWMSLFLHTISEMSVINQGFLRHMIIILPPTQ